MQDDGVLSEFAIFKPAGFDVASQSMTEHQSGASMTYVRYIDTFTFSAFPHADMKEAFLSCKIPVKDYFPTG